MASISENYKVLVAEDDINLCYLLRENLIGKGFAVTTAYTGTECIGYLKNEKFDICILDIMLPEADGFAIAGAIRKNTPLLPFLFLTARANEADRLQGFEAGADDYILKPFSFKELYYRIQVILRRTKMESLKAAEPIGIGSLTLDISNRNLVVMNESKKLSRRECELLYMMLSKAGIFLSRKNILETIWGNDDYFTAKSMDVFITRLRKLIKNDPSIEIENLYGKGYRIRMLK